MKQKKRIVKKLLILLLTIIIFHVCIELQQKHAFKREFEQVTSIKWPKPGRFYNPLFWVTWTFIGRISGLVTTLPEENERFEQDIKASDCAILTEEGVWHIQGQNRSYKVIIFLSDTRFFELSASKIKQSESNSNSLGSSVPAKTVFLSL